MFEGNVLRLLSVTKIKISVRWTDAAWEKTLAPRAIMVHHVPLAKLNYCETLLMKHVCTIFRSLQISQTQLS